MKSAVLVERDKVELVDVPIPEVTDPNSIRVRVTVTSICGSDIHLAAGHMTPEIGFALGHEWVGVVDAVGANVAQLAVGDRVTGPAAPWCGTCDMCSTGQPQRCLRGGVHGSGEFMGNLGGTQSEYLIVPWADNGVVKLPDDVSDEAAIVVGDVLSTGWSAVRQILMPLTDSVVIFGCGPVGLSAVSAAVAEGIPTVIAVDPVASRLEVARTLGATHTFASSATTSDEIAAVLPNGAPGVIDAAGVQASLDLSCAVVGIGGRIAVLGIPAAPQTINMTGLLMKNVTLWTGMGDLRKMPEVLESVRTGKVDPSPMFTNRITLDEAPKMYQRMAGGDTSIIKVIVRVSD